MRIDNRDIPKGSKVKWNFLAAEMTVNKIEIPVTVINGVKDGPTVVITAGVHPNELIGQAATVHLAKELEPEDIAGTLIFVHIENPMGLQFKYEFCVPDGNGKGRRYGKGQPSFRNLSDQAGGREDLSHIYQPCGLACRYARRGTVRGSGFQYRNSSDWHRGR